jgi:hypothetical protein
LWRWEEAAATSASSVFASTAERCEHLTVIELDPELARRNRGVRPPAREQARQSAAVLAV